ncbi:unnamed protein product [Echinostoma caproni]|uniref:Uncharacterized protein n=1 Tax=Echinostoma caproni TaxID=27848 RepID=A0A183AHA0_9TREM|nr:unnamed protein product [Echinostoma caproni]
MNKRLGGNIVLVVICTNLPESTRRLLRERQQDELSRLTEVCTSMGVEAKPVSLTRLWRPPTSSHIGEPRLLRVTLASKEDVKNVLLSSFLTTDGSSNTRILPDIPWTERVHRRNDPNSARDADNSRAILTHGVPQIPEADESNC